MSSKYKSYTGKAIKINLTTQEVTDYNITDEDRNLYLGGKILASKIMYDNFPGKIDPLCEENIIIITTGPLNAVGAPCSSRFNTSTISPLTGYYTSSNCGGNFGLDLKRAGYDAVIITGKAKEKTYLVIDNTGVKFKDATEYWGMKTQEVQEAIPDKGSKFVIGPAGENLVRYACVVSGERAAGRGGVGAVFGSKNLKGLVAYGLKSPEVYNPKKFHKNNELWTKRLTTHPTTGQILPELGTASLVTPMQTKNLLATKNYSKGKYEKFDDVSGETLRDKYLVRNSGCTSCPIRCARMVTVDKKVVKGPEVETVGLFGPNILNNDMQSILDWNYYMDDLGLDTISCGNTISYAMEANEKGLWKNGLEFGKIDNIASILDDIAHRKGIGNELAEGSKRLAEKYGGKEFAMNAKGMELAAYEPRGAVGQGLGYAVANRGGCHLNGGYLVVLEGLGLSVNPYTPKGKAAFCMMFQDLMEACSAGGNCLFTTYAFFPNILISKPNSWITRTVNKVFCSFGGVVSLLLKNPRIACINLPHMLPHTKGLKFATGMYMDMGKFLQIGERGYNLERLIDVKLGVSSKDDVLPARLTEELQISTNKDSKVPLDLLKKQYYKVRSWDKNGIPTDKILKKLKIIK